MVSAHAVNKQLCYVDKILLIPVCIRRVIVTCLKAVLDVDILCEINRRQHLVDKLVVVHGKIAVGLGQPISLVGDNGDIRLYALVLKEILVNKGNTVSCVSDRVLVYLLLHLAGNTVNNVNAVLILLQEDICANPRLYFAEHLAEGEMVGGVLVVKLFHKAVAVIKSVLHYRFQRDLGEFFGGATLAVKKISLGQREEKYQEAKYYDRHCNTYDDIFNFCTHFTLPPIRI